MSKEQNAQVSYFAYEAACSRYERIIERIAIMSLIDTIIAAMALIFASSMAKKMRSTE